VLALAALLAWSLHATGVGPRSLLEGREQGARLVAGLLRPDLGAETLRTVGAAAVQTLQISLAGVALAVVLAAPLGLLLAAPAGAPRPVRAAARAVAAVLRGVPELVWALVFVATVGLGPAAGVYALGLHGAGLLAKLWAEQLEAVDAAPVEAVRLTGAGRGAVLALAVVPQARAGLVSLALYQWECTVRTATVLGFVGAGGLGQAVDLSLRLFDYARLSTAVLAVLALVLGVDAVSRRLRARAGAVVAPG
jgi:phosphonate transport system permease protein